MLSRPVILIYVVSKTVVIFPPDHQLYLLPLFGDYPPFPSLLMTAAPLLFWWAPPLSSSPPPWSTNSVPCHPISRHTVLSGRGGGNNAECYCKAIPSSRYQQHVHTNKGAGKYSYFSILDAIHPYQLYPSTCKQLICNQGIKSATWLQCILRCCTKKTLLLKFILHKPDSWSCGQ